MNGKPYRGEPVDVSWLPFRLLLSPKGGTKLVPYAISSFQVWSSGVVLFALLVGSESQCISSRGRNLDRNVSLLFPFSHTRLSLG